MHLQPITRYPTPHYPTRAILDAHPDLLRQVPKRWVNNSVVMAALATTGLLAMAQEAVTPGNTTTSPAGAARVAPIFLHGEGRGAFGCVAVNPPSYLSEADAREIIREEAALAGIDFQPTTQTINIPFSMISSRSNQPVEPVQSKSKVSDAPEIPSHPGAINSFRNIQVDGCDEAKDISYLYSEYDLDNGISLGEVASTAGQTNSVKIGNDLRSNLLDFAPNGTYGIFYRTYYQDNSDLQISDVCVTYFPPSSRSHRMLTYIADGHVVNSVMTAPLETIAKAIGAKYAEDNQTMTVTLTRGKTRLELTPGSAKTKLNGYPLTLPVSIELNENAPVRAICRAFGLQVTWHDERDAATITDSTTKQNCHFQENQLRVDLRLQVRDFIKWLKAEGVI